MNQIEKEQVLNEVEHKIGMIIAFHKEKDNAEELNDLYEQYRKEGASTQEIKLFLEDLNTFLEGR